MRIRLGAFIVLLLMAGGSALAGVIAPSTSTLAATSGVPEEVVLTWNSAGDDDTTGDLTGNYRIQYATYTATWDTGSTPTNATTITIATTTQTPGSAQSKSITGLLAGTTYYFAIWTQDDANNWSGISNTTSAVGGYWFDRAQIEVDGAGNGLSLSSVAWGDYDNDGDQDILIGGYSGSSRELRIYKNNGNGTINATQVEVDGAGNGLADGGVAWGDYDNDGDLDILVSGVQTSGSTRELRIYKNNGNATIDPAQIEVDGAGGGLDRSCVAWGDHDNDGDFDIVEVGYTGSTRELRLYQNNGNGTINPTQTELDGSGGGLYYGKVAWGDFENDGDLDILVGGYTGSTSELRVYKNMGSGVISATQVEVDGSANGLYYSSVAWGDFDADGDLDILANGYGSTAELRVYKNNGNGTINTTQLEVDGIGAGMYSGGVAWGDFDNDGDIDILTSGYQNTYELRVYKNNGNATIDPAQIEVEGAAGLGLYSGSNAWGDYDSDGDLDILVSGYGGTMELRIYKNLSSVANTAPSAPGSLSTSWDYDGDLGYSSGTFKWVPGSDNGANPTPVDSLTYLVEVSTDNAFASRSVVAGQWVSPGMGNYLKPPKIYDGNSTHGILLRFLSVNTTYYFRVKTIDGALKESGWSSTGDVYTLVADPKPAVVTNLSASGTESSGQITLTWTAPLSIQGSANAAYDIRYSTTAAVSDDTAFGNATAVLGEPTPGSAGNTETLTLSGLPAGKTYYFGMKSSNDAGTSALDVSSPRASAVAGYFDGAQIDVDSPGGGLDGAVAWGDFENDGDLDILTSGDTASGYQLRVYKNNGNGTINPTQIEVDGANNGLYLGSVAWGDYDNDGDLDILAIGSNGSPQLRIYKNNGNATVDPVQIEVDGLNNGLSFNSATAVWGDYDNDGDLDIAAIGHDSGSARQLRVYKNNGNGTIDPVQIEVDGAGNGMRWGGVEWGDYDNDGDLDMVASGKDSGSSLQLRIYKNNGNGTIDPAQIEVDGSNGGLDENGQIVWGDYDNDGDIDFLISGYNSGGQLRVYKNNGNGTINNAQIEVDGAGNGLLYGDVAWGDVDNDGDLDIMASGQDYPVASPRLSLYLNNGNGTIDPVQFEVDSLDDRVPSQGIAFGDNDNDGDIDLLVNGYKSGNYELRVYNNIMGVANTAPAAPGTLSGEFGFNASGVSIASFTWNAGTDSGTGTTPENVLTYDVQISTVSNFSQVIFSGNMGASPRMGSYLKPPKIFNSNTYYGALMKSTDPWNAQTTASYGLRTDTTYYYKVKTVDAGLAESSWSSAGTMYSAAPPSTSTISVSDSVTEGEATLSWSSSGDDGPQRELNGNYRIQYATYTAAWSTTSNPTNATTVTVATTTQSPGSAQTYGVTGLSESLPYYFVLWTQDQAGQWSSVSNVVKLDSVVPSSSTLAATTGSGYGEIQVSWSSAGDNGGSGPFTGNYRIQYATYTAAWSTSATPTNATTVTLATTTQNPGSSQTKLVSSLSAATEYYFVLWTQDDGGNWSDISNTTSAVTLDVDVTAPSVTTLTAMTGSSSGAIDLTWSSSGDDGASGNLTGNYRIQYATFTASWSTSTTPSNAYTTTIVATNVTPGASRATTIVVSPTTYQPWYFVLWTEDEAGNWSTVSSAATGYPPSTGGGFGIGPNPVTTAGLSQGGAAWGDFDNDGDLDVLASGTDGSNNQVRAYTANGNGTFSPSAVSVASSNGGLKDGDVAWGDYDNDGDLDVLVSGTDNTNNQLRVYKNNGNGTFNTSATDVAGSNNGLKQGGVAWGDHDNDGDLDVVVSGTDGTNNQLRVYANNGNGTFNAAAVDVAGSNNGLKLGNVVWGDFDIDADLDVLLGGSDGTNRQLRVYANNGNGTFNATAVNVAGSNNGLSNGRVGWGDFDRDADLDVAISGTDGTNYQLRTYSNNGNGTFNATATNLAGANLGVTNSALAVGDYNVDGYLDVLAAGGPSGLVGYWKMDDNSGTNGADVSGYAHDMTLANGATWTTGKLGYAGSFDGSNDKMTATSVGVNTTGGGYNTVVFWMYWKTGGGDSGYSMPFAFNVAGPVAYDLQFYGTDFGFNTFNNDLMGIADTGLANTWVHVAGIFYNGTPTTSTNAIYINGVKQTITQRRGTPTSRTAPTSVQFSGCHYSGGYYEFNGYIDDARIYNRALSSGEVSGLYQSSKGSIGTLRIHKGVGDGTFNATPVEVDGGLEKGNVAWGDADGDGDLDILVSGSDASSSQVQVCLSTQSLTSANTAPTGPSTLTGGFTFSSTAVSYASFTWNAGSDSGTGSTSENGLTYDIRISTKSDFSLLAGTGNEGASPRLGSYLKPPKIFNGNTYYGVLLKSTNPWTTQWATPGLLTDTTYYYQVKTIDAGLAESSWSSAGTMFSAAPPSTSTLAATAAVSQVTLTWNSAGDDGINGSLTGNYRIQYATYSATWATGSTPADATTVTIATTTQTAGSAQTQAITDLTAGTTYYFVLWSQDDVNNWSSISNTTSAVPTAEVDATAPSTSALAAASGNAEEVVLTWNSAGDDDSAGDLTGNYRIQYATYSATWATGSTPTLGITVTIATTTQTPGSAQRKTITGLTAGTTYYFGLFTQDEANNWSSVSNTTSATSGYWYDRTQIEVDGATNGLKDGGVAWGDFENDGDLDILVSGYTGSTRELRVYKNNGNGEIDTTQIDVDGANGGLYNSSVAWGDFDNDGDIDILACGYTGSTRELRLYKNNGNATIDTAQIEVDGAGNGTDYGAVRWGDYDNDGDLDILVNGSTTLGNYELRVYKNNGNGTINPTQIDVDGSNGGLYYGAVAWGDFDNDGDLDILASGSTASTRELRIYKNNGNGSIHPTQIEVDAPNGGLYYSSVAWGDYDDDGDLDILTSGFTSPGSNELRVYKNNGNGTINNTQIEVDGASNGLRLGGVAWGDDDNDGDLDILSSGYTSAATRDLRVYKNNGDGTISGTQIEVDGVNGGLRYGEVAWGDYDGDGDIDILANGEQSSGSSRELRVYKNLCAIENTAPSAPGILTSVWDYNASGISTATFKWIAGSDNGGSPTPENVLTYQLEVSTDNGFAAPSTVAGQWTTPGMGNYLKPPLIFDGNTNYGVMLKYLSVNTTYYYRVKTVDAGLLESDWSSSQLLYTAAGSLAPTAVFDLVAGNGGDGQITLTWTAPLSIDSGGSAAYDVRYSTVGAITDDTEFSNATEATGEPIPWVAGYGETMSISGLIPLRTYYFAIKSSNDHGPSPLDSSSPRASAIANPFDSTQLEVDGANGGLYSGGVAWGDLENDGDLDILTSGYTGTTRELRIYVNNGNGTINPTQVEVEGSASAGLQYGTVAWGDYDNDGDLDILASGSTASTRELRVYSNNGNGTINPTQIEVDGSGNGLQYSSVAWGDYDNDGDLDILTSGNPAGSVRELRIYTNNGNRTFNPTQIEVDGANGGLRDGHVAWGDFDNDGDVDILANGYSTGGTMELRVYANNGNGVINTTQIEVEGANGGLYYGNVAWGDFDNDGDLDILAGGITTGSTYELRVYKNNGNGTVSNTQIDVDGSGNGLGYGGVGWGDFDVDGDLDILACGSTVGSTRELRVYMNNGNGTIDASQIEVDGATAGLNNGVVAWSDYDADGDMDILASGQTVGSTSELRIYKNTYASVATNTAPAAPGTLSGEFGFNASGVSIASFTWNAGTDSGTGTTPENVLTYDIQISTVSNFSSVIFSGNMGASPRMGSYHKPPKIFNGNTDYGVLFKSTDPWNAQTTASYGLRTDTTYYYKVKTIDAGLAESAWSGAGTAYTGVSPSTSTLAAAATATVGEIQLTWASAGDDGAIGSLTGNYRIQYATFTASWSPTSTPTDATTVTIATSAQTVGASQSRTIDSLTGGATYYFVLYSQDEVGNWSSISNTTSAVPVAPIRSCTIISGGTQDWGPLNLGDTVVGSTAVVISNDGNVASTYALSAATTTVASPWEILESTPTGPDALAVFGLFNGSGPSAEDYGVEDVIGNSDGGSSGAVYTVDGTVSGVNVPAGENRSLYLRLDMPTTSKTEAAQTIRVRVTAQAP